MKLAVFFPGIGYHCDKPLLFYSRKIACQYGYEVVDLSYTDLNKSIREAFREALAQAEKSLEKVEWKDYGDVLFVSKSIGTVVASAYAKEYGIKCRNVYYTPLEETFQFCPQPGIVFHGTNDPYAETEMIKEKCRESDLELHVIEGGNHSLAINADVQRELGILKEVMELTEKYVGGKAEP